MCSTAAKAERAAPRSQAFPSRAALPVRSNVTLTPRRGTGDQFYDGSGRHDRPYVAVILVTDRHVRLTTFNSQLTHTFGTVPSLGHLQ